MLQCPGLVVCPSSIPEEVCVNQNQKEEKKEEKKERKKEKKKKGEEEEWVQLRDNQSSSSLFLCFTYTRIILPYLRECKTRFFLRVGT